MRHTIETEQKKRPDTGSERPATKPGALASGNEQSLKASLPKAYRDLVSDHERLIQLSRQAPRKYIAAVVAAVYCLALTVLAGFFAVRQRFGPPLGNEQRRIYRCLSEKFHAVPEMALHKAIEVQAYLKDIAHQHTLAALYSGVGVDLGCGQGIVGGLIKDMAGLACLEGLDYYDHNEALVQAAGYGGFRQGDILGMPYESATFDYALSVCVFEHLPDIDQALAETRRILKPGGRFHFTTPALAFRDSTLGYRFFKALGLTKQAEAFQVFKDIHAMQYTYFSQAGWYDKLAEQGFEAVTVTPLFSRHQLFWYDLMNLGVYRLDLYFSDKLAVFAHRHEWFRQWMTWVTYQLCVGLAPEEATLENATHYYITCSRPAGEGLKPA